MSIDERGALAARRSARRAAGRLITALSGSSTQLAIILLAILGAVCVTVSSARRMAALWRLIQHGERQKWVARAAGHPIRKKPFAGGDSFAFSLLRTSLPLSR